MTMYPAAYPECPESGYFKSTIINLTDDKAIVNNAWLKANSETIGHHKCETQLANEQVHLSSVDVLYPEGQLQYGYLYGVDEVKAHMRSVLASVFSTSGHSAKAAQHADQTVAGHLYVDGGSVTRVGGVAVGNIPEEDLYASAIINSIRLATPYPCLIGHDPSATLPSGNPSVPPDYADLLDAINAARVAASAPVLAVESALVISTAIHCQWMLDHASVTEIGINDSTPLERARLSGYRGASVGEVRGTAVGLFEPPIEVLVAAWLADPAAAAVLLSPTWTRLGGYIIPWPGTGYLACVDFGVEPPA